MHGKASSTVINDNNGSNYKKTINKQDANCQGPQHLPLKTKVPLN